jgi:hypothetical protein
MDKCTNIQKHEKNVGMTVKETQFIFQAAVLSNDWGRVPRRFDIACEQQQRRHLTNARKIVDKWIECGTKEYAFNALCSSETGVLLIQRFNLWCKGRPKPVGFPSEENKPADAVVANTDTDSESDLDHVLDDLESDSDWEDVPTENEIPETSEYNRGIVMEATSSRCESNGETSVTMNTDVFPNNQPAVGTPNAEDDDDKFIEDDKNFQPRFEVEEDTLWKSLTFLQVCFMLLCFSDFIRAFTPPECVYHD